MIRWATDYFQERGVPSPRLSIEWLLAERLGVKRLMLYVMHDRPLGAAELDTLRDWVKRRARHEPLQHITGRTDFMNAVIHVNRDVLIPRPETEELVERILQEAPGGGRRRVIDLGTGSGCIAIALKMARPEWEVAGVDLSEPALVMARRNALTNGVAIDWIQADFTQEGSLPDGPYDLVVSNPPYIRPEEKADMERQVKDFEPELALFHPDPATMYSQLASWAARHLAPEGAFWAELNEGIDPAGAMEPLPDIGFRIMPDSAGKNRFLKMWISC
jgi:release factor glutamine methyltransferase